jgi:hypothetical protein
LLHADLGVAARHDCADPFTALRHHQLGLHLPRNTEPLWHSNSSDQEEPDRVSAKHRTGKIQKRDLRVTFKDYVLPTGQVS